MMLVLVDAMQKYYCILVGFFHLYPRDFANGFLVAEILSRYFKSEIQMHSFDNGTGITRRQDNWEQIIKFAQKIGFPISQRLADDVMNCSGPAASVLIESLYTALTQKMYFLFYLLSQFNDTVVFLAVDYYIIHLHSIHNISPVSIFWCAVPSVQTRAPVEVVEPTPAFARPTASQLVRDTMKQSGSTFPVDVSSSIQKVSGLKSDEIGCC